MNKEHSTYQETLISIIVPVYNVADYLRICVDSLQKQTYQNVEIILVDDGSTDESPRICDEYGARDTRIKVIHQKNAGLSAARNAGIRAAGGRYLGFVDSDDYVDACMYECLYQAITLNQADIAMSGWCCVDETGQLCPNDCNHYSHVWEGKEAIALLKDGCECIAWNKLYKADLFQEIRFPEGKINEDAFIMYQLFYQCAKIVDVPDRLYFYRIRCGSIMSQISCRHLNEVEAIAKKYEFCKEHELFHLLPDIRYQMKLRYSFIRKQVKARGKEEREHVKRIDRLFDMVYGEAPYVNILKLRLIHLKLCMVNHFPVFSTFKRYLCWGSKLLRYCLLTIGKKYILMNTPVHGNLGDHAIALAEWQIFDKCGIKKQVVEVPAIQFSGHEDIFAKFTAKNKVILLQGGGSWGDVWVGDNERQLRIIKSYKKNKIIILPQTFFLSCGNSFRERYLERMKTILTEHKNLKAFVRDESSFLLIKQVFPELSVRLVADVVAGFHCQMKPNRRNNILLCMRNDREKGTQQPSTEEMHAILHRWYPKENVVETDTVLKSSVSIQAREQEVSRKLQQFANARLVVTNRLHGMLFAAITNTPCIVFDNNTGKVKQVYRSIEKNEFILFAENRNDFEEKLGTLDLGKEYAYCYADIEKVMEPLYRELLGGE